MGSTRSTHTTRFTKVEGAGNDYVLVDLFDQAVGDGADFARRVSDRHAGIGSDGVLLVGPPSRAMRAVADARMRIFNADGSEGLMCGNGLRCVIRYLRATGRVHGDEMTVETAAGLRRGRLTAGGAELDMGVPDFRADAVPVQLSGDHEPGRHGEPPQVPLPAGLDADPARGFCVAVGNPHVVVAVPCPDAVDLALHGAALARAPCLPAGANVHFVARDAGGTGERWRARTWERGSGATQACGTGAVAIAAVARRLGWSHADRTIVVMPGGELMVTWDGVGEARLAGPARLVFHGEWRDGGVTVPA